MIKKISLFQAIILALVLNIAPVFANENNPDIVIVLSEIDGSSSNNGTMRSISSAPPADATNTTKATNYTQSAFVRDGNKSSLFVASDKIGDITTPTTAQAAEVLARVNIKTDGRTFSLISDPLAPAQTKLNGSADTPNPLNGAAVQNLTTFGGRFPAVSVGADAFLVTDGSEVLKNSSEIKDAGNNAINATTNRQIYALAASSNEIFAAVAQTDKTFMDPDGKDRGVAVLRRDAAVLNVLNAGNSGTSGDTPAAKIDLTVYNTGSDPDKVRFAFDEVGGKMDPTIADEAALFWDTKLSRLYIGLSGVNRQDTSAASGALTLAVGFLDKSAPAATINDVLNIQPIVSSPKKELFAKNGNDRILGFYFDNTDTGTSKLPLSIKKIRMMHTSTGRDYLIVNGEKQLEPVMMVVPPTKGIYALPVLGLKKSDGTDRDATQIGTIAKVDAATGVSVFDDASPTGFAQMPKDDQPAVRVGGELFKADVSELFVDGDSVFMFLAGVASKEVGIFHSMALFDSQGNINGWTPWQRVMGSMERAFGGGYDPYIGSFLFLTEKNKFDAATPAAINTANIFKVTAWGKTDALANANSNAVSNLSPILEFQFALDRGGVVQLFSFDNMTPNFLATKFSMMIALGVDRLALVQTGKTVGADQFIPETVFQKDINVIPFDTQAIKDLGPLCTADASRSSVAKEGWVFVGGYNGVAVLSDDASGKGYEDLKNLVIDLVGFSFKKLIPSAGNSFDHVRKLVCDDKNLYIMTRDKVFKIEMTGKENKFKAVSPDALSESVFFPGMSGLFLNDCVIAKEKAIVATNKGLFVTDGVNISEVKVGGKSLGPVIQLQYLSNTPGKASDQGNLYVLTGDLSKNPSEGKIYRFAVNGNNGVASVALPIKDGLLTDLQEFRGNFAVNGSSILTARGKHFDDFNYLNISPVIDRTIIAPLSAMLDVDFDKNSYVAAPVLDNASGAWMLPGDWGLRANL